MCIFPAYCFRQRKCEVQGHVNGVLNETLYKLYNISDIKDQLQEKTEKIDALWERKMEVCSLHKPIQNRKKITNKHQWV